MKLLSARASLPLLLSLSTFTAAADPLDAHEQNPLFAGFGIPGELPARMRMGTRTFDVDYQWGSTALEQSTGEETLVIDAETRELRLSFARRFGNEWMLTAELPYREITGGMLDGFIDGWHDVFGLPEGARPHQPKDRLLIHYANPTRTVLDVDRDSRGLADATLGVGRALWAADASAASLWLTLDLPTGDADELRGNDGVDASLSFAAETRIGARGEIYGQLGATYVSEADVYAARQRDFVASGLIGASVRATHNITLQAQFSGRTAFIENSDLDFFGNALALSVGGTYQLTPSWQLQLGVTEDIAVETGADVVLLVAIRYEPAGGWGLGAGAR